MKQIYYPEDSTAEWIDLEKECVLVGQRLVLARVARTPPWPALLFRASPSAAALCQNMRGYTSSGDYVEFFDENDSTLSNLLDVHVSNLRKKLGHDLITTRRGHGYTLA